MDRAAGLGSAALPSLLAISLDVAHARLSIEGVVPIPRDNINNRILTGKLYKAPKQARKLIADPTKRDA